MKILPFAKTDNFVVQNISDEILIYNLADNKAFCLNKTSAIVYQSCDGKTYFDELKDKSGFSEDLIHFTLSELNETGFVEIPSDYVSPLSGISRREAIKKVGLATMIALPLITSITVPVSANAASVCLPLSTPCTDDNDTQSDCCNGLRCVTNCVSCNPQGTINSRYLNQTSADVLCNISDNQSVLNMCCNSTSPLVVGYDEPFYTCECP